MSSGPAKGDEKGVAAATDEVELARMGYKQELKFVRALVWMVSYPDAFFFFFADGNLVFCRYVTFEYPQQPLPHNLSSRTLVSRSRLSVS